MRRFAQAPITICSVPCAALKNATANGSHSHPMKKSQPLKQLTRRKAGLLHLPRTLYFLYAFLPRLGARLLSFTSQRNGRRSVGTRPALPHRRKNVLCREP